ncbi:MAG: Crp/Fnr family transcriptional regulator [Thiomonas sp.]|uniref:Crp/Fnr family transcriptional regulator n=1 Tax=Thiomonas sp. TaxID=2047785 RepID=UPI002A368296|nr:Crp/Fnr family transcriptional regulator [Thiomonas sp.]MDY0329738.1 Crp/Fnr family transcriptional regulator [Thiomonas sp.]
MKRHSIAAPFRSRHPHPCDGHLPSDLEPILRQRITETAEATLELNRGEILVHSGEPFKYLYLLLSGGFKAEEIGEDGLSQIVSFHYAGEFMGLSAFAEQRYMVDLIALVPSSVCEFPMAGVQAIMQDDRALLDRLLIYVSDRLMRAEQDQLMLGSMSSTQKIAHFLVDRLEASRRGAQAESRFELPMTRKELGSYLGLSMETVSRLLSHLQEQGVVRVDKRQIEILREDQLRVWLDGVVSLPASSRGKPAAKQALKLA